MNGYERISGEPVVTALREVAQGDSTISGSYNQGSGTVNVWIGWEYYGTEGIGGITGLDWPGTLDEQVLPILRSSSGENVNEIRNQVDNIVGGYFTTLMFYGTHDGIEWLEYKAGHESCVKLL